MTDLEQREAELLGRARRDLSPTSNDERRILAATLAGAALLEASTASASAPAGAAPLQASAARYFLGVLALGVAGAVGYGWGYNAGAASARPAQAVTPAVGALPPGTAARDTAAAGDMAHPVEEPALRLPAQPTEPTAGSKPKPAVTTSTAPANAPAIGLDEEVRQLRRIERAIRDGNPRLALVLAEELERAIPGGQLAVERSAAVMMASCQLAVDGAGARAAKFVAQNPTSGYAGRLKEICKLQDDPQRN